MDEGKELLYKIIDNKILRLSSIDESAYLFNDVNLVELSSSIKEDIENISLLKDDLIEEVLDFNKCPELKKDVTQVRDLYLGKKVYHINVVNSEKNVAIVTSFINLLENMLKSNHPEIITASNIIVSLHQLKDQIKNKQLIEDIDLIDKIVSDYDQLRYNKNMIIVMNYVTKHNLKILNTENVPVVNVDTKYVRRIQIDDKIKDILSKLKISYEEIPNFLLGEIKSCNVDEVYKTYNLIRKKSAEDYGILHLIKKENKLAKLSLILYSNPEAIRNIIDSLRDSNYLIDMDMLKIIINNILSSFFIKNNEYFKPKYEDFMKNIELLKSLGVNYKTLIKRCPIFMISNNEVLKYTLDYTNKLGADSKSIINKCYKTLAIDPSIIIENINTLNKYSIDLNNYFEEAGDKYNLLKTVNLGLKMRYIIEHYSLEASKLDYKLINKIIVNKVYKECKDAVIIWGD